MAERASDTRELGGAVAPTSTPQEPSPPPIDVLSYDELVKIFLALDDPDWVRRTIPLVCKGWAELYRSEHASPLHEELVVDFKEDVAVAVRERLRLAAQCPLPAAAAQKPPAPNDPVVHASRVISWAARRPGAVRKLEVKMGERGSDLKHFSSEDLGALVAAAGPSLTGIWVGLSLDRRPKEPFWRSLREAVVPAGRLRLLSVCGIETNVPESDVEPLGRLAGSLETLFLDTELAKGRSVYEFHAIGLPRFPESFCALTELRWLGLVGHPQIREIPAGISSLKKLKELHLQHCFLFSLPRELGELSGLEVLNLAWNLSLGSNAQGGEALPAALGKMKSLRELDLSHCRLRAVPAFLVELESLEVLNLTASNLGNVAEDIALPAALGGMKSLRDLGLAFCKLRAIPAFIGELRSLEVLDLRGNCELQIDTPLDFLIEGCPRLREVRLAKLGSTAPWPLEALEHLEAFKARLLERNRKAKVMY